jgi:hypothetical protein
MFSFPRRRWVVESRPAMFPHAPWDRSLGPYFRKKTACDYMSRMRWFAPANLVATRVRDLRKED